MQKALTFLMIAALLFTFTSLVINDTNASKTVGGLITSDTTWSEGTYVLTGPVGIASGAELTIEPGVIVEFASYYIQVNGTLNAQGTSSANIIFTTKDFASGTSSTERVIQFAKSSTNWNDGAASGCIIQNALFQYISLSIKDCSPKISRNTFNLSGILIEGGSPLITYNRINCPTGTSISTYQAGSPTISNNSIQGTGYQNGIFADGNADITNNVIDHCWTGVSLTGTVKFTGNTVSYCNEIGVSSTSTSVIISKNYITYNLRSAGISGDGTIETNTVTNNKIGIQSSSGSIKNNNIYSNTENNFVIAGSSNIDVSSNYWGTTDSNVIAQTIRDSSDDFNLGTANYTPFLYSPSLSAPAEPLIAIGTPTPAPTPWRPSDNSVTQTPQPTSYSDWAAATGSSANGANTQLQGYIIQLAECIFAGVAIGWTLVIGFVMRKRSKSRRKNAKS